MSEKNTLESNHITPLTPQRSGINMRRKVLRKAILLSSLFALGLSGCGPDYKAEQKLLEENRNTECSLDEFASWPKIESKNIHIQSSILWLFTAEQRTPSNQNGDTFLRWGQINSSEVVKFLLSNRLQSLEIDMRPHGGPAISNPFDSALKGQIYRIYVAPEGNPHCNNYYQQYKYRPQVLPTTRRLGVGPDRCIAVEEVSESIAELRITAELVSKESAKAIRAKISAVDYSDPKSPRSLAQASAMFTVDTPHGKYGSGDYFAHCPSSIETFLHIKKSLGNGIDPTGDTSPFEERLERETHALPPRSGTEADALKFILWTEGTISGSDTFDSSGTVWTEGFYTTGPTGAINLAGDRINIFKDGKVLSRELIYPEGWPHGMVYRTKRDKGQIHIAVANQINRNSESHLWILLNDDLSHRDSVLFSKADIDRTKAKISGAVGIPAKTQTESP